jgi:hypothetical protein
VKFSFALVAVSLVACGGPLIEPGSYDVTMTITSTTDPFYEVGESSDATWKLSEDEGAYELDLDNNTVLEGEEKGNKLVFELFKAPLFCVSDFVRLEAELKPTNRGFKGTASQEIQFCNYYNPDTGEEHIQNWATAYTLTGTSK